MSEEVKYPVAEIFFSVQGEGAQSGMPMVFVRLAGCNVGKPYTPEYKQKNGLAVFQNECTIYDGRQFPCDTDYRSHMKLTVEEILEKINEASSICKWVSITGGEPLIHDLRPLLKKLNSKSYKLHLETSGTMPYNDIVRWVSEQIYHLVVSPKHPFIDTYAFDADEIRVLVDENFKWNSLPQSVKDEKHKLWISPVNDLTTINKENSDRCMKIVKEHPEVRISLQIHKVLGVR